MSVITGQFHLSPEQKRFFELLNRYPTIAGYWDVDAQQCHEAELNDAMAVLSHGEKIMAQFFCSLWTGNDSAGFGLVEAASTLSPQDRAITTAWLNDPFFP